MNLTSTAAIKVPPEMLTELALGLEDGVVVAQRYGFSNADLVALMGQTWFRKAIQSKQEGLEKEGNIFRTKMAMLAEDLLVDLWMAAKSSESGSLKLDTAKLLAKLADLEPKNTSHFNGGPGGGGFSITISIPENWQEQAANTSHVASQEPQAPPTINITPHKTLQHDPLPKGPRPLIVPDFDLSSDLMGSTPGDES